MSVTSKDTSVEGSSEASPRRKRWWVIGAVVLVLALVQSVTVTPAIHGRVVDEQTQEPLADVVVAALWNLEQPTLVDSSLPGGPVKMAETSTDGEGKFNFPTAVIIHWPLMPFRWYTRSDEEMPELTLVKQGYRVFSVGNDIFAMYGPAHDAGLLSLRSSSLENANIRMTRWSAPDPQIDLLRFMALEQVILAEQACSRQLLCQAHPLQRSREALTLLEPVP